MDRERFQEMVADGLLEVVRCNGYYAKTASSSGVDGKLMWYCTCGE